MSTPPVDTVDEVDQTAPEEEYAGPATLTLADREVSVDVTLRGAFQPIDGRFHWYGRIVATDALADVRSGAAARLTTPHGSADAKLSDVDPWGRFRITGTGRPPF
ncbi:DUF4873 domain-containing protein [Nocardioides daejeonensis]|uniref:DUF4873 domain-containing protein n=1 Tax=Nocardioides daejeonensis TaxID=1046556 RepID=UPI000D74213E|nr:DUF4873 domain-containing protein [Nocardioides daejeonensis]